MSIKWGLFEEGNHWGGVKGEGDGGVIMIKILYVHV
jgi:hypothetical protein